MSNKLLLGVSNMPAKDLLIREQSRAYLSEIEKEFDLPTAEWGVIEWKAVAKVLVREKMKYEFDLQTAHECGREMFEEMKRRRQSDKDRIANRQDQIDKRAFQGAVKSNIEDYSRKADAIRDLRIKPQFENYTDGTLRNWLKEIWDKPTKPGRSRKDSK